MAVSQVPVTVQEKHEHLHPRLSPEHTGQRCGQFPSSSPRGPQVIPNEVLHLQIPAWTKPGTPYTDSWPCWLNQFIHFYLKERRKGKKKKEEEKGKKSHLLGEAKGQRSIQLSM